MTDRRGFTIVESLIAIGLFSILVTIAVGSFVNALHTQHEVGNLISAQSTVSLSIEQMAREMRTGYLFCHTADGKLNDSPPLAVCGCSKIGSSGPTGKYPVWQCSELNFLNALSESTTYYVSNGALTRSSTNENNGVGQPLTGNDISVKNLTFILRGQLEGDNEPPFVTISISVSPSSTDPADASTTLHFQTSVSARQIDCDSTKKVC